MPSAATAALLQNRIGRPSIAVEQHLDGARRGVDVEQAAPASHTRRCPPGSSSMPSGRPPVSATRRVLPVAGSSAQIAPSSVPVQTVPSASDDDVLGAHRRDGVHGEGHGAMLA